MLSLNYLPNKCILYCITLLGHGAVSGIKFDGGTRARARASDKFKLVAMILPHINTIGSTRI